MKLTLAEAYSKATKSPLVFRGAGARGTSYLYLSDHSPKMGTPDAALLAHCFNVLPEVVEALNLGLKALDLGGLLSDQEREYWEAEASSKMSQALARAITVEIPE